MPSGGVANRYAAAVFKLAVEAGDVDAWRHDLAMLDELLQDEVLQAAFRNPAVPISRRLELARQLAADLRPQVLNLMRLLIEHRRTGEMQGIRAEFERLADEASGIVHAMMRTATAVSVDDQESYRRSLARKLGCDVRLRVEVDPTLIGGAMIQVGDYLVDGSVRTQLNRMREAVLG